MLETENNEEDYAIVRKQNNTPAEVDNPNNKIQEEEETHEEP
jgi:hypothetical protein